MYTIVYNNVTNIQLYNCVQLYVYTVVPGTTAVDLSFESLKQGDTKFSKWWGENFGEVQPSRIGSPGSPKFTCTENTVALIDFASRSLPVKVHLKKNPEVEKLDGK